MMMKGRSNRPWKALMGNLRLMLSCLFIVATASATDRTVYYHTDFLGSVVAATDESGTLLWRESYRPFGERIDREVSTKENTPFYTGKPHDDDTGLSYFGARDYDPIVGRFLGIDPVGVDPANLHSFNRYAYANNNPYKYVDPDGKFGILAGIAVGFGLWFAGDIVAPAFQASPPAGSGVVYSAGFPLDVGGLKAGANLLKPGVEAARRANGLPSEGGSVGAMLRLKFEPSSKHGTSARQTSKGVVNPGPKDGQHALDNSLQVKSSSSRRIGVDKANNEIVLFDETSKRIFHGHVRLFKQLTTTTVLQSKALYPLLQVASEVSDGPEPGGTFHSVL